MTARPRWRLACFDLDGTLVPNTTTCLHLAGRLGHRGTIARMESELASGALATNGFAATDAAHYAGHARAELERHLDDLPLIDGLAQTINRLRSAGISCLLCTVTWRFAALTIAKRFDFDGCSGAEMGELPDGRFDGTVMRHFDEYDKREFVAHYCRHNAIAASDVFAVGDGHSDVPMFGFVGHSVALNASAAARAAATTTVQSTDLRAVFDHVPDLQV